MKKKYRMKYFPLLIFLSFYFYSLSQSKFQIDETTYLLNDSLVFERFTMEPLNGIIYDDFNREIGLYVDGRREGVHNLFDEYGSLLIQADYNYNKLHGQFKIFFPNGKLMEETTYDFGVEDGISRSYHENGKLKTEDYYNHGIRHGLCRKWWVNGQLAFKKEFESGLSLSHTEWDINGRKTLDHSKDVVVKENEKTPPFINITPPAPPPSVEQKVEPVAAPIPEFPDVEAGFPGGPAAMMKWINDNVKYPQTSIEMNEQGRVFLSFVVEKDGSITNVKVERGISIDLDKEAKRVVRKMPKWLPAKTDDGSVVRSSGRLPINFQLH